MTGAETQNLVEFPQYQSTLAESQTGSTFIQYNLDVTPSSQWFIAHTTLKVRMHLPYIQELGEYVSGKNYMTTRKGLESYLLNITLDGEGYLDYNGIRYQNKTGQFFWIDCRNLHHYAIESSASNWNTVWLHFWGNSTHEYYKTFTELNDNCPIGSLKNMDSVQIIRKLISYYCTSPYNYQTDVEAACLITNLMTNCITAVLQSRNDSARKRPPEFIPAVQDYITAHYNERITLDSLANIFYVNKFYLQKQFLYFIGCSPYEYQRNIRIDKAKEFLRATPMPVGDISENLGFETASYFIHSFKKVEGKTPLQYRREWGM